MSLSRCPFYLNLSTLSFSVFAKALNKVYAALWALKWLSGGIFWNPLAGAGPGIGGEGVLWPSSEPWKQARQAFPGHSDGKNVTNVSSPMPRWSRSNQPGVWWNVKVN